MINDCPRENLQAKYDKLFDEYQKLHFEHKILKEKFEFRTGHKIDKISVIADKIDILADRLSNLEDLVEYCIKQELGL